MKAFGLRVLEALPLSVFLLYMVVMDPRAQAEWRTPYYAATALALAGVIVLWRTGATLNRIYLGITLYFISGTIALLTRWPWLNEEYGRLEGTAMLMWVLVVGLVATIGSPRGFAGIQADPRIVRRASLLLLAITAAATVFSLAFVGQRALSSFAPFIVVFISQALIARKMRS
jgi:multisubunit Na+/H+ antiporter MnhB subunit